MTFKEFLESRISTEDARKLKKQQYAQRDTKSSLKPTEVFYGEIYLTTGGTAIPVYSMATVASIAKKEIEMKPGFKKWALSPRKKKIYI